MKRKVVVWILIGFVFVSALSGYSLMRLDTKLDALEDAAEYRVDYVEDQIEAALHLPYQDKLKPVSSSVELTADQAKSIALEHAGYTADQVTGLYAERDLDDGIHLYEVRFRIDRLEYDYDIHADNGKILSFDLDD